MRLVVLSGMLGACASEALHEGQLWADRDAAARSWLGDGDGFVVNHNRGEWLSIASRQDRANFGNTLVGGDFNGDGFSDVVAVAPLLGGAAFLFPGSETGLQTTPAWVSMAPPPLQGADYGHYAVSGEVNGDGITDLVIGAPYFTNGQSFEGAFFVFHGSATGLPPRASWHIESNVSDDKIGDVACVDLNGDSIDEILFSNIRGVTWVVIGSSSDPESPRPILMEEGFVVSSAGDVNGDGFEDLLVYRSLGLQSDVAAVHLGTATGLEETPVWLLEMPGLVESAGDVNDDGFDDLIAGAPEFDSGFGEAGAAFLYLGSESGPSTVADWQTIVPVKVDEAPLGPRYGFAVSSAGDMNGDGFDDVAVGAYLAELVGPTAHRNEGIVYIFHGSTDGLPVQPSRLVQGARPDARLGYRVAPAGDVDADGYDEIVAHGASNDWGGTVYLIQGHP